MTELYDEARKAWSKLQARHGLSDLRLAGGRVIVTPEQSTRLHDAAGGVPLSAGAPGPAGPVEDDPDGYVVFPVVVLSDGQEREFADGWKARNRAGVIQTMEPGQWV